MSSGHSSIAAAVLGLLGVAFIGAMWVLGSLIFSPLAVPEPGPVWRSLSTGWQNIPALAYIGFEQIGYQSALRLTVTNTLVAGFLGTLVGACIGLVMGEFRGARFWLQPVLILALTMPVLIALPFFQMWFGANRTLAMSLVGLYAAVTTIVVVKEATTTVGSYYRNYAASMGVSPMGILRSITLPAIMPDIVAAARVAIAGGWGFACIADVVSGEPGMGRLIALFGRLSNMAGMVAGVLALASVAMLVDLLLLLFGKLITQWQE